MRLHEMKEQDQSWGALKAGLGWTEAARDARILLKKLLPADERYLNSAAELFKGNLKKENSLIHRRNVSLKREEPFLCVEHQQPHS